jgi:hypothetical protein
MGVEDFSAHRPAKADACLSVGSVAPVGALYPCHQNHLVTARRREFFSCRNLSFLRSAKNQANLTINSDNFGL